MKFFEVNPPRRFNVGNAPVELRHTANLQLSPDELVTLLSPDGRELDIVSKNWGYYLTPSLQGRLKRNGMRGALMRNIVTRQLFVVVVYLEETESWRAYMSEEDQELVMWLDLPNDSSRATSSLGDK